MKYSGFSNSYSKHFISIISAILGLFLTGLGIFLAQTVKDCIIALLVFITACSIVISNELKVYMYNTTYNIVAYIEKDYIYGCDVNIISKLINNISKLCKNSDKCIESFIDCEYLETEDYICFGDADIRQFVSMILKGISNRYNYKVLESGYNRVIALDLWDINKKLCIYITNLDDRQLVSFRPIRKAQMMGLKVLNSDKADTYKVEFYNPAIKLEMFNMFWVLGFAGLAVTLLMRSELMLVLSKPLAICTVLWIVVWYLTKRKITRLTVMPEHFIIGANIESEVKDDIKQKMFDNIIKNYNLNEHEEYLRNVFDEQGIIYSDTIIFSKTEQEFRDLVKESLVGVSDSYQVHIVYGTDGSRQAGITFDTGIYLIFTLSRLDNSQIITIT